MSFSYRAPAKVNIFLKITGTKEGYHTIRSRFIRFESLYDTLEIVEKERPRPGFELLCDTPLPSDNTLSRAYELLKRHNPKAEEVAAHFRVRLTKKIPAGAGLGGGSSDAAALLHAFNEIGSLALTEGALAGIGAKVGADVPFFVYRLASANVEGIGEEILPFDETPPPLILHTPPIHCDTAKVYTRYRRCHLQNASPDAGRRWLLMASERLLASLDPFTANDLYRPAKEIYPELTPPPGGPWFFSGSGSTFFRPTNADAV